MEQQWEIVNGVWRETTLPNKSDLSEGTLEETIRYIGKLTADGFGLVPIKTEGTPALFDGSSITTTDSDDQWHLHDDTEPRLYQKHTGEMICYCSFNDVDEWIKRADDPVYRFDQKELFYSSVIGVDVCRDVFKTDMCPTGRHFNTYATAIRIYRELQEDMGAVVGKAAAVFLMAAVKNTLQELAAKNQDRWLYWRLLPEFRHWDSPESMHTNMSVQARFVFERPLTEEDMQRYNDSLAGR